MKTTTKQLYLSLPITGCELESIVKAHEAAVHYRNQGFEVVNPHDVKTQLENELGRVALEREIIGHDLLFLSECDAMILFPGWEKSKGCNLEIRFALDYNIPIYEVYTDYQIKFDSKITNKVRRRVKDSWITQPRFVEVEELPVLN